MKKCNKCNKSKSLEKYHKKSNICKKCKSEYNKKWYKQNKEKFKIYNKTYYEENKEKNKPIRQKYYKNNKESIKKIKETWRKNNQKFLNKHQKEWADKNKNKILQYRLKREYNLTIEQYNKMIKQANGKCAICNKSTNKLHIDHNHDTGQIRGLLCFNCNCSLGGFKDNISILEKAVDYLKKYRGKNDLTSS